MMAFIVNGDCRWVRLRQRTRVSDPNNALDLLGRRVGLLFRRLVLGLLVMTPVTLGVACASDAQDGATVIRWEDIPRGAVVVSQDTVPRVDDDEAAQSLMAARSRLLAIREEWGYGTLDGPQNTLWAWIRDVATDREGHIYVVDGMLNLLRVLSPSGDLVAEAFRPGDGPMELRTPAGAEFVGDTLVVFSHSRFVYATGDPQDLREAGRFTPQAPGVEDACIADETMFVKSMPIMEPVAVRTLDLAGNSVGTFGTVFEHSDVNVRATLSRGHVACIQEPRRVVTSFHDGSLIYAYEYDGTPVWTAHLEGFRSPRFRGQRMDDGSIALSNPGEAPEDRVQSLTAIPGGLILVQVNRMDPFEVVDGRRVAQIRRRDSYLLSARTGAGVYVGSELPEVLHATDRRLFVMDADVDVGYVILKSYLW